LSFAAPHYNSPERRGFHGEEGQSAGKNPAREPVQVWAKNQGPGGKSQKETVTKGVAFPQLP